MVERRQQLAAVEVPIPGFHMSTAVDRSNNDLAGRMELQALDRLGNLEQVTT